MVKNPASPKNNSHYRRGNLIVSLLSFVIVAALGANAWAWVATTTTESQTRLKWLYTNCIQVRINTNVNSQISDGSVISAIKKSGDTWIQSSKSCSYITFSFLPESSSAQASFSKDGANENTIELVTKNWPHDAEAAALTTVFFYDKKGSSSDGQILDADIEINGQWFQFSTRGEAGKTDVQNAITHEMGHMLGLDHLCDDGSRSPIPKDNNGQQVPSCLPSSSLPAWIKNATMYNFADPGEIIKRTPKSDDIAGVCATYPLKEDPGNCNPPDLALADSEGCSLAKNYSTKGWTVGLFLLFGLLICRRRRRVCRR